MLITVHKQGKAIKLNSDSIQAFIYDKARDKVSLLVNDGKLYRMAIDESVYQVEMAYQAEIPSRGSSAVGRYHHKSNHNL